MAERDAVVKIRATADVTGIKTYKKAMHDASLEVGRFLVGSAKLRREKAAAAKAAEQVARSTIGIKGALKAVAIEFPFLARAMRLAMTPIGAAATGAIIAYQHIKKAIEEAYDVAEFADLSKPLKKIDEAAIERTRRYADNIRQLREEYFGLAAAMRQTNQVFDAAGTLSQGAPADPLDRLKNQASVIQSTTLSRERQRALSKQQTADAAQKLAEAQGLRRRAAGIAVPLSGEQERANVQDLRNIADALAPQIAAAQEKYDAAAAASEASNPDSPMHQLLKMRRADAKTRLDELRSRVPDVARAEAAAAANARMREAKNAMLERADKLEGEADRQVMKAREDWRSASLDYAAQRNAAGLTTGVTPRGSGQSISPQTYQDMQELLRLNAALARQMSTELPKIRRAVAELEARENKK